MEELTPIEALMAAKLGEDYEGFSSVRNRNTILMSKLRNRMTSEVVELVRGYGAHSPPFDPFSITQIGKARVKVLFTARSEIGADGSIEVSNEGFAIRIDRRLLNKTSRLRSTMAHELMHTVFYDTQQIPPIKIGLREPPRKDYLMEEELCYYLARQLLMPDFSLIELMNKENRLRTASLTNLRILKKTYGVSSDLVAFRLISDLALWDSMYVKSVKKNSLFKTSVMKSKKNSLYCRIQTPKEIPSSRNPWAESFSRHIDDVTRTRHFEEIINLKGKRIALESEIEAEVPLSIVTLAYVLSEIDV